MQLSMMIAEVGFMLKVSGSRIATPLAPPRPGSTPISTPRMMPTSMKPRFGSVAATPKPWTRLLSSSIYSPSSCSIGPLGSGTRNQRSKIAKNTSGTPTATGRVRRQRYLPKCHMK